ncbi:MAG: hypothetical protein WCH05_06390 [Chlorobiaceae bacterium]
MKKLLSLAAVLAAVSYALPASAAELKIGGDASVRVRSITNGATNTAKAADDVQYAYRLRLNGAADFEDGYIFRAVISNEAPNKRADGTVALGGGGGFQTIGYGNTELYTLGASQLYFGRFYGEKGSSHYLFGRLPLNATNNPVFDLHLYPSNPLDVPAATFNNDRLFGGTYGTKIGDGDLNVVVGVFDNLSTRDSGGTGDGLLNDGYALSVSYKVNVGNVTVEPQLLTAITQHDTVTQSTFSATSSSYATPFHQGVRPVTFGANVAVPAGEVKLNFSGFATSAKGTTPSSSNYLFAGANVDYSGYLLRAKVELGQFLAWYDYNKTNDKSATTEHDYTNNFIWAQYKIVASKQLTIQPTVRYLTSKNHTTALDVDTSRLRSEVVATIAF